VWRVSPNAGKNFGIDMYQDVIKPKNIAVKKTLEVFRRGRNLMKGKELPNEAEVRSAGKFQIFKPVHSVKLGRKYFGEGLDAGATRMHEGAVNIEKDQSNHAEENRGWVKK